MKCIGNANLCETGHKADEYWAKSCRIILYTNRLLAESTLLLCESPALVFL